jgi:hypothetical protein
MQCSELVTMVPKGNKTQMVVHIPAHQTTRTENLKNGQLRIPYDRMKEISTMIQMVQ